MRRNITWDVDEKLSRELTDQQVNDANIVPHLSELQQNTQHNSNRIDVGSSIPKPHSKNTKAPLKKNVSEQILEILKETDSIVKTAEFVRRINTTPSSTSNVLKRLVNENKIKLVSRGHYTLPKNNCLIKE